MQTQCGENIFNSSTVSGQRKMNCPTTCRFLRLSPLICIIIGSILTVVGQTLSLKICQIAGPVVMSVGGFLLVFITLFWISSQALFRTEGSNSTDCGEPVNTPAQQVNEARPNEASNFQLRPIHHFDVWIPSKPSGLEIAPPSYEDAVTNNYTESLEVNSAVACDEQEQLK